MQNTYTKLLFWNGYHILKLDSTISGEIVGCAYLRQLHRGPFFNDIFTTDILVYFI